jgi:hypothetical protein
MSLFAFSALFGTPSGPLAMGYVAARLGWRWIEWIVRTIQAVRAADSAFPASQGCRATGGFWLINCSSWWSEQRP